MPAKSNKPRVTSSRNRSTRSSSRPVTQGQNPQRSNRQQVSTARVTQGGQRAGGRSPGGARVTTGRGGSNLLRTAARAVGGAARVGRAATPAAIAYETLKPRPTAAGTISANDPGTARRIAAMQKSGKEWEAQERLARQRNSTRRDTSFEDAFRDARLAKVKTFTWKGKRYTTEMAK